MAVQFIRNRLLCEYSNVSGDEEFAKFAQVSDVDRLPGVNGIRNLSSPEDVFSDNEELVSAAYYPQSSLAELVAWGAMNESSHIRSTLSDLDGDSECW